MRKRFPQLTRDGTDRFGVLGGVCFSSKPPRESALSEGEPQRYSTDCGNSGHHVSQPERKTRPANAFLYTVL
jgi:hypothetical protein